MSKIFLLLSIVFSVQNSLRADDAGKHSFEYKVTVAAEDLKQILKSKNVDWDSHPEKRIIYFFDDSDLTLFRHNLLLRARMSDTLETTAKVRPIDYEKVGNDWFDFDGFKCETDVQKKHREVPSCSLSENQPREKLRQVLKGEKSSKTLYKKAQEEFARDFSQFKMDWDSLLTIEPIESRAWQGYFQKPSASQQGRKVNLELWTFARKNQNPNHVLEISVGAKSKIEFDRKRAWLLDLIRTEGWHAESTQETKTRKALKYFTQK